MRTPLDILYRNSREGNFPYAITTGARNRFLEITRLSRSDSILSITFSQTLDGIKSDKLPYGWLQF